MREFWDATYEGKQCKCCKPTVANAAELLLDKNLVWSADFEAIREDLGQLLISIDRYISKGNKQLLQPELQNIVNKLMSAE